jgi:hypothetical protein
MMRGEPMMISVKAVHSQADAHRQELMTAGGRKRPDGAEHSKREPATQRSVAGSPVAGGRAVRRSVAPRIGTWLIEFGTRLGGASIRTS